MQELKEIFGMLDTMMIGCDFDYYELRTKSIDSKFFDDYQNVRIVNSFLFNYSKIQDKIGAKLLKKVLYMQKEIDNETISMRDALNLLEKLGILQNSHSWDRLREIRNNLSHEYPHCIEERIENISLAMEGYTMLIEIYSNLKEYCEI